MNQCFIVNDSNSRLTRINGPTALGSFNNGGIVYFTYILDDIAFLSDDTDGLEIVNISVPTNPRKISEFNDEGHTRNLMVVNNLVFITDLDDGLEILEFSNIPQGNNQNYIKHTPIVVILISGITILLLSFSIKKRTNTKLKQ